MVLALLDHGHPIPGEGHKQKVIEGLHFPAISNNIYFLHDAPNDPGDNEGGDDLEDRRQQLDQEPAVPGVRKGALGLEVFRKENGLVEWENRFL